MYTVIWKSLLLDRLAVIYVDAEPDERERMALGVEAFNIRLALDPLDVGESRVGGYRVAFPPLLQVSFHVDEARRRVSVTDVIRFGR
jgi:hypothetical protein